MVEVETKQEKRVKRKEEVSGLRKERGEKRIQRKQTEGRKLSGRKKEKKPKRFSCYLQSCLAEGAAGTAGPEF